MGFTLSSIHVYTSQPIGSEVCQFASFSDHWQTCITPFERHRVYLEKAKKLSKTIADPVLCFGVFDSDYTMLDFFQNGKIAASYRGTGFPQPRNLYQIPKLVGYETGEKRRLSKILACPDAERQIGMLEELFGVCLLVDEQLLLREERLHKTRGNAQYLAYVEEEKALAGAHSNLKVELVLEQSALLDDRENFIGAGYYPLHYFRLTSMDGSIQDVHFQNGALVPLSRDEREKMLAQRISYAERYDCEMVVSDMGAHGWRFTDHAPKAFAGRAMKLPAGFYPFAFQGENRFLLSNLKNSVAFMDESLKVIKKVRLQGIPYDVSDGYILTYHPFCARKEDVKLRIYRICDGKS